MWRNGILALLVLGVVVFVVVILIPRGKTAAFDAAYWKAQIDHYGADSAYEHFAAYAAQRPQGEHHVDAHQFGSLLYDAIGLKGAEICDSRFGYGCLHQVIGMAVSEYGTDAIPRLEEQCKEDVNAAKNPFAAGICHHALGHGFMYHFGYDEDGLQSAVAACAPYSDSPHRWCEFGVFMEFNVHFMQNGPLDVREQDERGEWYPCTEFTGVTRDICYYTQPRWWRYRAAKEGETDESVLAQGAGKLCSELSGEHRTQCFKGIGSALAWNAAGEVERKGRWCDAVSEEIPDRVACKSDLAYSLLLIEKRDHARQERIIASICAGLEGREAECSAYASVFFTENTQKP